MLVPNRHQGSAALLYRESSNFAVEAIHQFSANVIARQLATGDRCLYIIGCYLLPGDGATIRDVEAAMSEQPRGTDLIITGNLNVDLEGMGEQGRDKDILVVVATARMEDP